MAAAARFVSRPKMVWRGAAERCRRAADELWVASTFRPWALAAAIAAGMASPKFWTPGVCASSPKTGDKLKTGSAVGIFEPERAAGAEGPARGSLIETAWTPGTILPEVFLAVVAKAGMAWPKEDRMRASESSAAQGFVVFVFMVIGIVY